MVTVKATLRTEDFGSAGARRLIAKGLLPGEIYGKEGNVHIVLNAHEFDLTLRKLALGAECQVLVGDKVYNCVFQDLQENIMKGVLMHADFLVK